MPETYEVRVEHRTKTEEGCRECGGPCDRDCAGRERCPQCDGPRHGCSDG